MSNKHGIIIHFKDPSKNGQKDKGDEHIVYKPFLYPVRIKKNLIVELLIKYKRSSKS